MKKDNQNQPYYAAIKSPQRKGSSRTALTKGMPKPQISFDDKPDFPDDVITDADWDDENWEEEIEKIDYIDGKELPLHRNEGKVIYPAKKNVPVKPNTLQGTNYNAKSANPNQCPLYKKCGGCQLQNLPYDRQLEWKQNRVLSLLRSFCKVNTIIGMDNPYHYRNKVQAAFKLDYRTKKIVSGVYQSSTHNIVPVESCLIEDKIADKIIVTIRSLMKSFKIIPYNEDNEIGLLRHVLVKRGFTSGQIMVVLVLSSPILPAKNNFVKALLKEYPQITTIIMNVNPNRTSLVLGDIQKVLYGGGTIEDTLCGCKFRISPKSFYQINPIQTEILYKKAIDMANLTGKETVIDAYCGIGTIGIIASKYAKNVIGVESNQDAVRDAIANAKLNNITNAKFYKGDAGEFMLDLAANKPADIGEVVVMMDPPRAGSDEQFLSAIATLSPKRVVYISCNPQTLQRDLTYLCTKGYAVQQIQPVDMFPHTNHVECVVALHRVEK